MLRLRELAVVTLVAMGGMAGLVAASQQGLQVPGGAYFHIAKKEAAQPIMLASAERSVPQLGLLAADGPTVQAPDYASANSEQAMDRLRTKVPSELYQYFDVYLYVSKAAGGSLAQHLYMFKKDDRGTLRFEQSFAVSTGRERHEKYFTSTPVGLFSLDPNRFERYHYSRTWNAGMPYSMFLNASFNGRQTGIALHSAGGHVAQLGSRASGGCVRLPPAKAAELFQRFRDEERGYVPRFAYDYSAGRTSAYGQLERDSAGKPIMYYGYKVLVVIENYSGEPTVVAAIV
jgi:hypothetical protein